MKTNPPDSDSHAAFMRHAISLSKRGQGLTAENPSVGCVIVQDGLVVGAAFTAPGGRPHAEPQALAMAGELAKGADVYVTLEPCAHHGRTPPCADALIKAGVKRVYIAQTDPDNRVAGKGIAKLVAAGIVVETGLMAEEALPVLKPFFTRLNKNRPFVTLKMAMSVDGRTALANGESQWITGPEARRAGHLLRARADAIMVGSGTALADDPALDCRIEGLESASPLRVVVDRRGRLASTLKLFDGSKPTLYFGPDREDLKREAVEIASHAKGVESVLRALADKGIGHLVLEGGATLAAEFMRAKIVDQIWAFTAGKVLGGESRAVFDSLGLHTLQDAPIYDLASIQRVGADYLAVWDRKG